MAHCIEIGDTDIAADVLEQMRRVCMEPNTDTFHILINGYYNVCDGDGVMWTHCCVLQLEQYEIVVELYDIMKKERQQVDDRILRLVELSLVELQDKVKAKQVNKEMVEYGFQATDEEFKELVQLAMKR